MAVKMASQNEDQAAPDAGASAEESQAERTEPGATEGSQQDKPEYVSRADFESFQEKLLERLGQGQNQQAAPDPKAQASEAQKRYEQFFAQGPEYVDKLISEREQRFQYMQDRKEAFSWLRGQEGYSRGLDRELRAIIEENGLDGLMPTKALQLAWRIFQQEKGAGPSPLQEQKKSLTPPGTKGVADQKRGASLKSLTDNMHNLSQEEFDKQYSELIEAHKNGSLDLGG